MRVHLRRRAEFFILSLVLLGSMTALPVSAQGPVVAPCSAAPAVVAPCGAKKEPPPGTIALLDEQPIASADLDDKTRQKVDGLNTSIATARAKALRTEIDDLLIALESSRRGMKPGELVYREVILKTAHPGEDDIRKEIGAHPEKYKGDEDDRERAAGRMFDRDLTERRKRFLSELEQRYPVTIGGNPGTSILATAGNRSLTAQTTGSVLDRAETRVRIETAEEEREAVDRVVHTRLLAAEAKSRGISPEELVRLEVTSKVGSPTDEELRAYWEKWKTYFGPDFEKARADVAENFQAERQASIEQAFDSKLREGHVIRTLFSVPDLPVLTLDAGGAPARGPRDARVTMIEFADFECPSCGQMSSVVEEALQPYGDKVRYVFRQYPLSIHPSAWTAAESSLAAHAQGKFFPYAHLLFEHQQSLDTESLKKYAAEAGLDVTRFSRDLESGRYGPAVVDDQRAGDRAGIDGTPTFFVNGVQLDYGAYSVEGIRAAVDRILKDPENAAKSGPH